MYSSWAAHITVMAASLAAGQAAAEIAEVPRHRMYHRTWVGEDGPLLHGAHGLPSDASADYVMAGTGGSVWIATSGGSLDLLRPTALVTLGPRNGLPFATPNRIVQDSVGRIWGSGIDMQIATELRGGAIEARDDSIRLTWVALPDSVRYELLTSARGGGVWLGLQNGGLSRYRDPQVDRWSAKANGLPTDRVAQATETPDGALWLVIVPRGFGVQRNDRYRPVPVDGDSAPSIVRVAATESGRVWVVVAGGAYISEFPGNQLARRLGASDGVPERLTDLIVEHGDTPWGVEQVLVDGLTMEDSTFLRIPPNPFRVAIQYTVTNLLTGEQARVDYRLDPIDTTWIEGAGPRVATYTLLRPATYRFRVRGRDENGNPTASEAALAFEVLPAWYQTLWFRGLVAFGIISAATGSAMTVHRRRVRRATELLRSEFRGKLSERTRIARELHDTLLQEFAVIVLKLDVLRYGLGSSVRADQAELSRILTLADSTLFEARQSVWDMRARELDGKPLAEELRELCVGLADGSRAVVQYASTGDPHPLGDDATATVLRICREALRNVLQHAEARTVSVTLRYEPGCVILAVTDDGMGMNLERLNAGPPLGHFGLVGMRERASHVNGVFSISSAPGVGTKVELVLPVAADSATSLHAHAATLG